MSKIEKLAASATGYGLLFGLTAYVFLYWGYNSFYSRIGLSPGDVGLGYQSILSSSVLILAVFGVPIFLLLVSDKFKVLLFYVVLGYIVMLIFSVVFSTVPVGWRSSLHFVQTTLSSLSTGVNDSGRALSAGDRVDSVRVAGVTVFNYKAVPATLHASDRSSGTPDADDPAALRCVLYLGESGGRLVVYEPLAHRVLRVSSSGYDVTLDGRHNCRETIPAQRVLPVFTVGRQTYVRAVLRVDGRAYPVVFPARSVLALRSAVQRYVATGATKAFRLRDGSVAVLNFTGATAVEVTAAHA